MADEEPAPSSTETPAGESVDDGGPGAASAAPAGGAAGEVERLRAEVAELKDRWLRERAELENYKKRAARETAELVRFGSERLLRDLLPVIDNLERALAHARTAREVDPLVAGIELVLRSLSETLARHGARSVEARGSRFDPSVHEAIGHVESAEPPNTVIDEHQRGYVLHDRLLRPALVTVGKGAGRAGAAPAADGDDVEKPPRDG
jgi:molecular chaperone GrpE